MALPSSKPATNSLSSPDMEKQEYGEGGSHSMDFTTYS